MSYFGWEIASKPLQLRTAIPAVVATFVLWRYVTSRVKSHVGKCISSEGTHGMSLTSASQVAVPAVGSRFPGLAFISAINALFKYDIMIEEGHRKVRRQSLSY